MVTVYIATRLLWYTFSMIDWTHIYNDYKGKWVAIKSDHKTVVASGRTAVEARDLANKAGFKKAGLFYVPKKDVIFVG